MGGSCGEGGHQRVGKASPHSMESASYSWSLVVAAWLLSLVQAGPATISNTTLPARRHASEYPSQYNPNFVDTVILQPYSLSSAASPEGCHSSAGESTLPSPVTHRPSNRSQLLNLRQHSSSRDPLQHRIVMIGASSLLSHDDTARLHIRFISYQVV